MQSSQKTNFLPIFFLILTNICKIQAQNTNQNASSSNDNSNNVKLIVSLVVILSFSLIVLILLCYCYKTTVKLENFASKIRLELANEYQNALNLQLEQAIRVNTYLLKSLVPEKPLMGKSMLKSSWWKRSKNSPKKKPPGESKLIQLRPLDSNGTNGILTDPRNNV